MKKILTILLILVTVVTVSGQPFEGKIIYQNSFKSKVAGMSDEQFGAMMGNMLEYYIKGGNYKSVMNGTYSQWQLYINKDNKLYTKISNSESILWNDCSVNADSVIKSELHKGVTEILGYKCDELILTCKSGTQKYYFNTKLVVDTKLYANHKYGNWFDYLNQANAISLKMIIDNEQFTIESIATEIKPMKLDDSEFQLPANAKTEKNPY